MRSLAPPITGTGVVARELLRRLAAPPYDFELVGYSTRAPTAGALPRSIEVRVGRGPTARWGSVWLQTGLRRHVLRDDLDLFWGPLQVLPLLLPRDVRLVVTMHDLVFRRFPETMSWRNRVLLPRLVPPSLRRADLVTAVSETTAADVERELGVPREKLRVVPNGVAPSFAPGDPDAASRTLLFVGTREPRKNLGVLLDALILLLERNVWDGELALAGLRGWGADALSERLRHPLLEPRVRFLDYVQEEELPALYRGAQLFVLPSLYEGFGLPVLEAMASGVPVVCSDAPPFPEVAGDAALRVPATDAGALATAIERVWSDPARRAELREKGLAQAARFSWDTAAERLAACFRELL